MTSIYFVRHGQPLFPWPDDATKPLTEQGMRDSERVTDVLRDRGIEAFWSSPYTRSVETIRHCADAYGMPIRTDERLRERTVGDTGYDVDLLDKRWADFTFAEPGGENLADVQARNVAALRDVLRDCAGKTIAIGTHGTALSTILHWIDPAFGAADFRRIWHWMPYILRLDFDGETCVAREEVFHLER